MSLMTRFLSVGHLSTTKGFPDPSSVLATVFPGERDQHSLRDASQSHEAPVSGNRGGNVAVSSVPYTETVGSEVVHSGSNVSAFIDQYVPIPWIHGDQKMSGNA